MLAPYRSQPHNLTVRWQQIYLRLAVINTSVFHLQAIWMTLLLLQQSSCKVHESGIGFVSLTEFVLALSITTSHRAYSGFRDFRMGNWAGAAAPCVIVGQHYTRALSARYGINRLPGQLDSHCMHLLGIDIVTWKAILKWSQLHSNNNLVLCLYQKVLP